MRIIAGKVLRGVFSFVEAVSEGLGMFLSTLVSRPNPVPTTADCIVAAGVSIPVFFNEFNSNYHFQGSEIMEHFSNGYTQISKELSNKKVTIKQQVGYGITKYGNIGCTFVFDYLLINLFYSAFKAASQNLKTGEDNPVALVSWPETVGIVIYYCLLDLPFILTNEIPQASEGIRETYGIPADQAFDKFLTDKLISLVKPIASSPRARKAIRLSGFLAQTFEEVTPLFLTIPLSLIRQIAAGPTAIIWGVGTVTVLGFGIIIVTVGANAYLFEGGFTEANLKKIAGILQKEPEPWVNPKVSMIFNKLLILSGVLHGVDTALDLLLTLREFDAPLPLIYTASIITFLIAWIGNHYSEVKKSQEVLKEITLNTGETTAISSFFKPRYDKIINSTKHTYEVEPDNWWQRPSLEELYAKPSI